GLLGATEELQRNCEPFVGIDGVAERHDVDPAVAPSVVDKPADNRQPLWAGVTQLTLRLGLRVRNGFGWADWRNDIHVRRLLTLRQTVGHRPRGAARAMFPAACSGQSSSTSPAGGCCRSTARPAVRAESRVGC